MKRPTKTRKKQKGQALLVAMIFLLALTFLGFGLVTISTIDIHSARNLRLAEQALTVAEQGALLGMAYASNPATRFSLLSQGDYVTITPEIGDTGYCQVDVIMGGPGPVPEGEMFSPETSFAMIRVQSEGWIGYSSGSKPQNRTTIEIEATIRVFV